MRFTCVPFIYMSMFQNGNIHAKYSDGEEVWRDYRDSCLLLKESSSFILRVCQNKFQSDSPEEHKPDIIRLIVVYRKHSNTLQIFESEFLIKTLILVLNSDAGIVGVHRAHTHCVLVHS